MVPIRSVCLAGLVLLVTVVTVGSQESSVDRENSAISHGLRLAGATRYLIVAPRKVRPDMLYEMRISVFKVPFYQIRIRATLSRNGIEYANSIDMFFEGSTKRLQLKVPDNVLPGEHMLKVEGIMGKDIGRVLFRNETRVEFDSKYVSIFIQTDRPFYYPDQTVHFRVLGLTPDLKPVFGTLKIFVLDANNNTVLRWRSEQLNMGVFSSKFDLTYPVKTGTWKFRVEAFNHEYVQQFGVEFFYPRIFMINVTSPMYIFDTEWGIAGTMYGEHKSFKAASGNATISVRLRNKDGEFEDGEIKKDLGWITGTVPFTFSMSEIHAVWGRDVWDKDLYFKAWMKDWWWLETQNGTSVTRIIRDGVRLKYLGKKYQTFKPNTPTTVYFAVERTDGTPYVSFFNRQVVIQRTHEGRGGKTHPTEKLIIPDDHIIRYTFIPTQEDNRVIVRAWHQTGEHTKEEIWLYKHYSKKGKYISITTSTEVPKVNEYMIFTVRSNFVGPDINYVILGAGTILLGDSLRMKNKQKTFAVALSRQMAPKARIVLYTVEDGEVLTDALNFFVKDTSTFTAEIKVNAGKDFRKDTIEIIGRGDPGGYISLNAHDYELYRRGAHTFLTLERLVDDLSTYDEPFEGPFRHIWYYGDERWEESVFFNSKSTGMEALTIFETSGLVSMSDRNISSILESVICNSTLGLGRCLSGECYDLDQKCDGYPDCMDGYDEAGCKWESKSKRRAPELKDLSRMPRYFHDTSWAWTTTYIKPTGQSEIKKKKVPTATLR